MIRLTTIAAASVALLSAGPSVAQQTDLLEILHSTSPLTEHAVTDDGEGGGSMSAAEIDAGYGPTGSGYPDAGNRLEADMAARQGHWGEPSYVPAPATSGGKTCYTGPRGGTYTITRSGKKNYSGC